MSVPEIIGLEEISQSTEPGIAVFRFSRPMSPKALAPLAQYLPEGDFFPQEEIELLGVPWMPNVQPAIAQRDLLAGLNGLEKARFYRLDASFSKLKSLPFPVDGYHEAIKDYDWDDFGGAVKFGEEPLGLQLFLDSYLVIWARMVSDGFRHLDLTFDKHHRSVHFWGDRFTEVDGEEHVHLFLGLMGELHKMVEILHMTFEPATMAQKYGGLMGDETEPFVLAGNPIAPIYKADGLRVVERWISGQTQWSPHEIAHMLKDCAIDVAIDEGRIEDALPIVTYALELASEDSQIQYAFARIHLEGAKIDSILERLPSFDPEIRLEVVKAMGEAKEQRFEHAVEILLEQDVPQRVFRSAQSKAVAWFGDVTAKTVLAVWQQCIEQCPAKADAVLRRTPLQWVALSTVAHKLRQAGDKEHARQAYELFAECWGPPVGSGARSYAAELNNACNFADIEGLDELAERLAKKAIPYSVVSPYLPHNLACVLVGMGKLDDAFAMVERAIDSNYPSLAEDWGQASGSILETDSDLGDLLNQRRFKDLYARWREFRRPLSDGNDALKEYPERAVEHFRLANDPRSPIRRQACIGLSRALLSLKKFDEAFEVAFRGLQEHEDPDIFLNWIEAARESGKLSSLGIPELTGQIPSNNDTSRCAEAAIQALESMDRSEEAVELKEWINETRAQESTQQIGNY